MQFLETTVFGGVLFLLPLVLVLIVLAHALRLAERAVQPISKLLPDAVVGVGGITILAVATLVIISFIAGLVARTNAGKRVGQRMELSLLSGIPQYQFVKSMAEGLAHVKSDAGIEPALISIEGGWQIGYFLEILDDGWVAVILPQAPTPMSGTLCTCRQAECGHLVLQWFRQWQL